MSKLANHVLIIKDVNNHPYFLSKTNEEIMDAFET